jgi:AraC-like DNA-binding protein
MSDSGEPIAGETAMAFQRQMPHSALLGKISAYTDYIELGGAGIRRRELPSGDIAIIINFGEPFRITDSRGAYGPLTPATGFIAGLHNGYAISESTGRSACVEFRLLPIVAHRLLRERMSLFYGQVVDLEAVFGVEARRLSQRLAAAPNSAVRFAIVEHFLLRRLNEHAINPALAEAVIRLRASGGSLPIRDLAVEIGYSGKHMITLFRDAVGATPKVYARLLRLERAVKMIHKAQRAGWAEIALACGYYDQAHFIREFRQFTGDTPTAFLIRALPEDTGWREDG